MINFVFVSPNFPARYFKWAESLAARGIRVLGIGDSPYNELNPRLISALTEYYFTPNLGDYAAMEQAVAYFEKKYGHIDYIESDNEWWLEQDARLRERFNVSTGFHPSDMRKIKAKSAMKEYFQKAGAKTMRYLVVKGKEDKEKAIAFQKEVGWPLFVKPDIGVGASDSYRLKDQKDFDAFFEKTLPCPYIMEEYIKGVVVSFDGICDDESNCPFIVTDHFPIPPEIIVNENTDDYYYTNPFELPMQDLDPKAFEKTGRAVVKSFGIRKRFFHIEFFVLTEDKPGFAKQGEFVALECNMRPPGGYTPDLIDYGISASVYEIYADIVAYNENRQDMSKEKYYSFAISRRDEISYVYSAEEVIAKGAGHVMARGRYPDHLADDMGNSYLFVRFKDFEEGRAFCEMAREKKAQAK